MDLYNVRSKLNMGIPLSNIKLRVTDYARVSTDHEEQKKSLRNQVEHFEQYIKERKDWIYVPGYVDDGISGTSDIKRNNFMKMIEDARLGKFDLIITKEISRFSRNTLDSIKYTRELLSYGVAVLFVNDNINTAMPDSELRLTIMASMAQDEIRRLSERVKFGMNRAIKRGEILGNNLLYGYKKDKNTKTLNIVKSEASNIKRIYELYAIDNLSLTCISKILNREKIKTSRGKNWSVATLSRLIENPKYKGFYCAKKSEVIDYMTKKVKYFNKEEWVTYEDKIKIPPIISSYLWERANKRLVLRKKRKNIKKKNYIYSGKIYCANHNKVFYRREFKHNKNDAIWVCKEYLRKGKVYCDSPIIRESELNEIFSDIFSKLNINLLDSIKILLKYYKDFEINKEINENIKIKEKELNNICIRKDKLLELNIQNILSNEEFKIRNDELNYKIKSINKELKMIKENNKNNNLLEDIYNILKLKIISKNINNKIINLMLNFINVSKIDNNKNNIKLDIYLSYKFNKDYNTIYEFNRDNKYSKKYTVKYNVTLKKEV